MFAEQQKMLIFIFKLQINVQQYAQFCTLNNNENGNFGITVFTKLISVPKKKKRENERKIKMGLTETKQKKKKIIWLNSK